MGSKIAAVLDDAEVVRVSDDALPHHYPTHRGLEEPERSDSAVEDS